jgi:hypothetical protein
MCLLVFFCKQVSLSVHEILTDLTSVEVLVYWLRLVYPCICIVLSNYELFSLHTLSEAYAWAAVQSQWRADNGSRKTRWKISRKDSTRYTELRLRVWGHSHIPATDVSFRSRRSVFKLTYQDNYTGNYFEGTGKWGLGIRYSRTYLPSVN